MTATRHRRPPTITGELIEALERGDAAAAVAALTDDITRSFNLIRERARRGRRRRRQRLWLNATDDSFELYDLRVEVVAPEGGPIYCGAKPGDYFELRGEMLHLPPGQGFSIYSLAAVLPLLAAKQRPTHANDWMTTDAEIACPDPNCSTRLRITRHRPAPLQPCARPRPCRSP